MKKTLIFIFTLISFNVNSQSLNNLTQWKTLNCQQDEISFTIELNEQLKQVRIQGEERRSYNAKFTNTVITFSEKPLNSNRNDDLDLANYSLNRLNGQLTLYTNLYSKTDDKFYKDKPRIYMCSESKRKF
jgi:hypothetical protein